MSSSGLILRDWVNRDPVVVETTKRLRFRPVLEYDGFRLRRLSDIEAGRQPESSICPLCLTQFLDDKPAQGVDVGCSNCGYCADVEEFLGYRRPLRGCFLEDYARKPTPAVVRPIPSKNTATKKPAWSSCWCQEESITSAIQKPIRK